MFLHVLGNAPILFQLFFLTILAFVIFGFVRAIKNYISNATSPILDVAAKVVGKRTQVTRHAHHGQHGHMHHSTRTQYFVTFELDDGERIELVSNGKQYGQLVEGDIGMLTYQGEWFKNFDREHL